MSGKNGQEETTTGEPEPPGVPHIIYGGAEEQTGPKVVPLEIGTDETQIIEYYYAEDAFAEITELPGESIEYSGVEEYQYILLGTIMIPKLEVKTNLLEGTGDELHHGAGHLRGTALPGREGNCVIAAHRTSNSGMQPFRYMDKLEPGDLINITFGGTEYAYETYRSVIVTKDDLWVLHPFSSESHMLTLVTCDPVISVSGRTNRLIVWARLINDSDGSVDDA
ncbi:MAG: class D sortase [Defluviitaleaceae bacterium]|nr:class D sortase [Defluviitaleaceae bacterium]